MDYYLEPLADALRSPYFWCFSFSEQLCTSDNPSRCLKPNSKCDSEPGGCGKYSALGTQYLLVPAIDEVKQVSPTGRRYFFDLGSTLYNRGVGGERDSFKWFKETYAHRGVEFDHIFAWEAKPVDHQQYWAAVPADVAVKLVFYNIPAVSLLGHPHNPLTHILAKTAPSDYVVLKVDIDNSALEEQFIRQLLQDPDLLARVDELYWEHHVTMHPLANTPGTGWRNHALMENMTLADSYEIFTQLRQAGVRAHSWV